MSDMNQARPEVEPALPVAKEGEPEPAVETQATPEPAVVPPATVPTGVNARSTQMVVGTRQGPGFLARAVWFVLIGWWLTAIVIVVAYALALSILGLPFAFYLFNRIPAFLTLRGRSKTNEVETMADGRRYLTAANVQQRPMLLRAIWFILIGFWFGAIWMALAYVLCVLIVTMPFGLAMFNRVGAVMTLLRY
jgi:uncharacterized membrane protein YccF (DUF307 family)